MAEEIPSIIHHVSAGTNDFDAATAFYDKVLATIGARRIFDIPGVAVAYRASSSRSSGFKSQGMDNQRQ